MGASATTVKSVARELSTADKPPTNKPKRPTSTLTKHQRRQLTQAARRLVNAQQHLAGARNYRLRLWVIALLTRQAALYLERGEALDWSSATRYIHERLEAAALDDKLTGNECSLVREALSSMRADKLADEARPGRGTAIAPSIPAPEPAAPPTLEDLAHTPHVSHPTTAENAHDYAVSWLARAMLDAHAKRRNLDQALPLALAVLKRSCPPEWHPALMFAAATVKRSTEHHAMRIDQLAA